MLKELYGNPVTLGEIAESRNRTSSVIADWFAELEKNNEVLARIVMDSHEFASLRLAMGDEFKSSTASELIEGSRCRKNTRSIKMGVLWTAEVYVTPCLEWVELTGSNGTKIQKLTTGLDMSPGDEDARRALSAIRELGGGGKNRLHSWRDEVS